MKPERLYFVVRSDLSEGKRMAQALHAMDLWTAQHGPQQGTVIVYQVPDEVGLLDVWAKVDGVMFREPDLSDEATAFATPDGPMKLPLLGSRKSGRINPRTKWRPRRNHWDSSSHGALSSDSPNRLLRETGEGVPQAGANGDNGDSGNDSAGLPDCPGPSQWVKRLLRFFSSKVVADERR